MAAVNKILLAIACLSSLLSLVNGQCSLQTATPKFRRAIYDFSSNLIKRVAQNEDYHFVLSPLSVWTLLSVASEGANGPTRDELQQVLRLNKQPCFKKKFYELIRSLNVRSEQVTVQRSGLIVADQSLQVKDAFQSIVRNNLGVAHVKVLDFFYADEAVKIVNDFVTTQSLGNIDEAINADDLTNALMLLVDTVYFKGKWQYPFNAENTRVSDFYDEEGLKLGPVTLMTIRSGEFNCTEIPALGARVLELPYGSDRRYSMLVILPFYKVHLADVIDNLGKITLTSIFKTYESRNPIPVEINLPRFKITSELDTLKELLEDLGIKRVFDESQANLSGISDLPLYVSKVLQKAEIEVTEEGTEASAATTAFASFRSQPELFDAEKPFMYLIVERPTQTILFAGAYSTPSEY